MDSMAAAAGEIPAVETRAASPPAGRTLAAFHLAETSGPSRSLIRELRWLAEGGTVEVAVPRPGRVADVYGAFAEVSVLDYQPATLPNTPLAAARALRRL